MEWGKIFGLDAIIRGRDDYFIFDSPDDFRLMLRADLWRIGGFDERNLLGWHVDANAARRLSLLRGPSGELAHELQAYHCEHARQVTPKHVFDRPEDDFRTVVEDIDRPLIDAEIECFGLPHDTLEEIHLDQEAPYVRTLRAAVTAKWAGQRDDLAAAHPSGPHEDESAQALPFAMDALASYSRDLELGWFGGRHRLLAGAAAAWRAIGFRNPIRVAGPAPWLGPELPDGAAWCSRDEIPATAKVCVLDFPAPRSEFPAGSRPPISAEQISVIRVLRALSFAEGERTALGCGANAPAFPCRVIAVEVASGRFESLVKTYVGVTLSPVATRIRQGFVLASQSGKGDLLPAMTAGTAGRRDFSTGSIALIAGAKGFVCYGPYLDVVPGRYRVTFEISDGALPPGASPALFEILSGDLWLAHRLVTPSDLAAGAVELKFSVPPEIDEVQSTIRIQVRLKADGLGSGTVRRAWLEMLTGAREPLPAVSEWLPLFDVDVGTWTRRAGCRSSFASGPTDRLGFRCFPCSQGGSPHTRCPRGARQRRMPPPLQSAGQHRDDRVSDGRGARHQACHASGFAGAAGLATDRSNRADLRHTECCAEAGLDGTAACERGRARETFLVSPADLSIDGRFARVGRRRNGRLENTLDDRYGQRRLECSNPLTENARDECRARGTVPQRTPMHRVRAKRIGLPENPHLG